MKAIIILNGECGDYEFLKHQCINSDYVICADGGYNHAVKAGICPDLVLGDFDSCSIPENVEILKYPVKKDFTDGELAVMTAKNKGFEEIILTCALGGRQDHALANLMLLDERVHICEKNESVYALTSSKVIREKNGTVFSIIPVTDSKVSIKGAKYPIENKEIFWGSSLTLSNETLEDETTIQVIKGKILLFINN